MGKNILFASFTFWLLIALSGRVVYALPPGQPAPGFTLEDTSGRSVSMAKLSGRVIALNFFSVSCSPCRQSISVLNMVYGKYRLKGFLVLGVTKDPLNAVRDFERGRLIEYPVLLDTKSTAYSLYDVLPIPVTYLIGKNGVIAERIWGPPDPKTLQKEIDRLLFQP